jgi:hypothetical protein
MDYIRTSVPNDVLEQGGEVESDRRLYVGFKRVEDNRLSITFRQDKATGSIVAKVEVCELQEAWEPYWQYVLAKIDIFLARGNGVAPGQSPNKSLERTRER